MDANFISRAMARVAGLVALAPFKKKTPKPSAKTFKLQLPPPELPRARRKNVAGCFGQHKRHRTERACRRVGRELRELVAFRGRRGLRFASRARVAAILRRLNSKSPIINSQEGAA